MLNIVVSRSTSVSIKRSEEEKCIILLCSFPDSRENMVVAIGSTTQCALKFEDVVFSLLLEEMRKKDIRK